MKRVFLFLLPVMMLGLTACYQKLTAEQAEAAVLQGERDRIPLLLQTIPIIDDITIDSIHLTVTQEPMQGYLYTTWISYGTNKKRTEIPIIVQVDSIRQDATRKDYIQWQSSWDNAAKSYVMKILKF